MLDWLASTSGYWLTVIVLAAIGLLFLALGLLTDLIRHGRRKPRCRRCRYDMSGTSDAASPADFPRKCPECGCAHKREKHLHRTRIGWKRAILGGLLLWAAGHMLFSDAVAQRMKNQVWYLAALPDTGRVFLWPWLREEEREAFMEQWAPRLISLDDPPVKLYDWQARWLLMQLEHDAHGGDAKIRGRAHVGAGKINFHYFNGMHERAWNTIRSGLHDPDGDVRTAAIAWCAFDDNIQLSEADLSRLMDLAVTDPKPDETFSPLYLIKLRAASMSRAHAERAWATIEPMAGDPRYAHQAVSLMFMLNRPKATEVVPMLMSTEDDKVWARAIGAIPNDAAGWALLAELFDKCPENRALAVAAQLSVRDSARWRKWIAEIKKGTDDDLKKKVEQAMTRLPSEPIDNGVFFTEELRSPGAPPPSPGGFDTDLPR